MMIHSLLPSGDIVASSFKCLFLKSCVESLCGDRIFLFLSLKFSFCVDIFDSKKPGKFGSLYIYFREWNLLSEINVFIHYLKLHCSVILLTSPLWRLKALRLRLIFTNILPIFDNHQYFTIFYHQLYLNNTNIWLFPIFDIHPHMDLTNTNILLNLIQVAMPWLDIYTFELLFRLWIS